MNKLYFLVSTGLLLILFSCESTPKKVLSKPVIDEKEFLNHEIINDSIEYRIKEFDQRNQIIRNVCVFKNDELIKVDLQQKSGQLVKRLCSWILFVHI